MEMLPRIVQCSPGVSRLWITPGKRKGRGGKGRGEKEGKKGEREEEKRKKKGRKEKREKRKENKEKRIKKSLDHGVKGLRAAYFMRLRRTY